MAENKVKKVMHEFKEGSLHSGSKHGPEVTNRKQAVAIALSEQRKAKSNALHNKKSKGHKYGEREARSKKAGYYVHGHKNYGDVYED